MKLTVIDCGLVRKEETMMEWFDRRIAGLSPSAQIEAIEYARHLFHRIHNPSGPPRSKCEPIKGGGSSKSSSRSRRRSLAIFMRPAATVSRPIRPVSVSPRAAPDRAKFKTRNAPTAMAPQTMILVWLRRRGAPGFSSSRSERKSKTASKHRHNHTNNFPSHFRMAYLMVIGGQQTC